MMNVTIGVAWLDDRTESRLGAAVRFDLVSYVAYSVLKRGVHLSKPAYDSGRKAGR
jgi:hypothetical protein